MIFMTVRDDLPAPNTCFGNARYYYDDDRRAVITFVWNGTRTVRGVPGMARGQRDEVPVPGGPAVDPLGRQRVPARRLGLRWVQRMAAALGADRRGGDRVGRAPELPRATANKLLEHVEGASRPIIYRSFVAARSLVLAVHPAGSGAQLWRWLGASPRDLRFPRISLAAA